MNRLPIRGTRRVKVCAFCAQPNLPLDYKAVALISKFLTERGKIVPRRRSGLCAIHQRRLAREIKLARFMALLPFSKR